MKSKKAQLSLGDAPTIVLIVGFVFLIMATMAYIGSKYGAAMPSSYSNTTVNETVTIAELAGNDDLDGAVQCNPENYRSLNVRNTTKGPVIAAANYTINSATGQLKNLTSEFITASWLVTYTFDYAGVGCTVSEDLQTEISNNTSIAGIVLTISLVGIVLSILIGIFMAARRGGM